MRERLSREFYTRPTLHVARDLLGTYIVRQIGKQRREGMIIETEAYIGPKDLASHGYGGKITPRNEAEFMVGGHIYIYLVYGMYWQLNISTFKAGTLECVLIRALFVKDDPKIANGPGKLCTYLKLNKRFYGEDLTKSKRIWLEDRGVRITSSDILTTPRIGIEYAGPYWSRRHWRFLLKSYQSLLPKSR